jgi:hypothetical protein
MSVSDHYDADSAIAAAQICIVFQFRVMLQQAPGFLVGRRPVLPEDACANLAAISQFPQPFLHRNAYLAAGSV